MEPTLSMEGFRFDPTMSARERGLQSGRTLKISESGPRRLDEIRARPMVTVVYEPKTPDLYSGESGGNRTVTPFA